MAEPRNQLLERHVSLIGYRQRVIVIEQKLASVLADVKRITLQHTSHKDLFNGIHIAFTLHKTVLQHCAST